MSNLNRNLSLFGNMTWFWSLLALGSLILLVVFFDADYLSMPIEGNWDEQLRKLLVLFITPLVSVVTLWFRFRSRLPYFWQSYGLPTAVIVVLMVWLIPTLINEFNSSGDDLSKSTIESILDEQIDMPQELTNESGTAEKTSEPPVVATNLTEVNDRTQQNRILTWVFASLTTSILITFVIRFWLKKRSTPPPTTIHKTEPSFEYFKSLQQQLTNTSQVDSAVESLYRELLKIVAEKAGLHKSEFATVREFKSSLISYGFPENAVNVITDGFERSRYGKETAGQAHLAELKQALAELTEQTQGFANSASEETP